MSCAGVAPRGRDPAIGQVDAVRPGDLEDVGLTLPTLLTELPEASRHDDDDGAAGAPGVLDDLELLQLRDQVVDLRRTELVSQLLQRPFAVDRGEQPAALQRLLDVIGHALEPVYGFRSLLAFKAKFQPEYRPLHLCYPDPAALPAIGLAIARAYGVELSRIVSALRGRAEALIGSILGPLRSALDDLLDLLHPQFGIVSRQRLDQFGADHCIPLGTSAGDPPRDDA